MAFGDPAQLQAEWIGFYDANYDRVVRFMMHAGASRAEAQDAAQEAFTESWKLLSRKPAAWQEIEAKAAWIRVIAMRSHARPPGVRRRPLTTGTGGIPDQTSAEPDFAELSVQTQAVLQALRSLDSDARTAMAFNLDGFTAVETARAMNLTPQRVRDLLKRARSALKRQLADAAAAERRQP